MIYFDKQIQEEIKHIEFQMEHLNEEEFLEDIKDENPVIEAFQKDKTEKKIELYKKAKGLLEKALKLHGKAAKLKDNVSIYKERNNLIREALIIDLNADVSGVFYDKKDEEILEEFEAFKNNYNK